ncbi:MAG TPA: hypothetical protein VHU23_18585 [Rhizomicrobium sp.]|jgi:hypothetical protein|nr:hypothetical protein [Rhizomicrobium sp.]
MVPLIQAPCFSGEAAACQRSSHDFLQHCREMAAAAQNSAATATFPDIRQSYLRLARLWDSLAAQAES